MSKRPFAVIGFSSLLTAVVLAKLSVFTVSVTFFVALAVFLFCSALSVKHKKLLALSFLAFGVALASFSLSLSMKSYDRISRYNGKEALLSGTVTDRSFTNLTEKLTVKVNSVNGQKENFYITVYNDSQTGTSVGDKISAKAKLENPTNDEDEMEYYLANKRYFITFQLNDLNYLGQSKYYKNISKVKSSFENAVYSYLPNNQGAVTVCMTTGNRSAMSKYLRNCFNFSGTAHLLVVSGLHLTLWTSIISSYISVLRKKRLLNLIVNTAFVLFYFSLTGFCVSVIRAGVMILTIKLSKCLKRDADSINSMGIAVLLLILSNPFSCYSVSLWLSVMSSLGLILFSTPIKNSICKYRIVKKAYKTFLGKLVVDTLSVSLSVTVLTLPVFVMKFKMFPVLSFVSNFVAVNIATILMVCTVLGALLHLVNAVTLAKALMTISGVMSNVLIFVAEKVGMLRYSTVGVSSRYFRVFLIIAFLVVSLFYATNKFFRLKRSFLVGLICVAFALTAMFSEAFEQSHISIDVAMQKESATVLVRNGYDSVLLGVKDNSSIYSVSEMLGRHNLKSIGSIYSHESNSYARADILRITSVYPTEKVLYKNKKIEELNSIPFYEYVNEINLSDDISITPITEKTCVISNCDLDILISSDISRQNLFENGKEYDIIILNMATFSAFGEEAKSHLKNSSSQIICLSENEQVILYPNIQKIYLEENF